MSPRGGSDVHLSLKAYGFNFYSSSLSNSRLYLLLHHSLAIFNSIEKGSLKMGMDTAETNT